MKQLTPIQQRWQACWTHIRDARSLSVAELADLLGEEYGNVWNWLHSGTGLNADRLVRLFARTDASGTLVLTAEERKDLIGVFLDAQKVTQELYPYVAQVVGASPMASATPPVAAPVAASAPSAAAEADRPAPHFLVFIPSPWKSYYFFDEVLRGISEYAASFSYHPIVMLIPDRTDVLPIEQYHSLESVAGVIAVACDVKHHQGWIDDCQKRGKPLVLVHDNIEAADVVGRGKIGLIEEATDGLAALVEHLIQAHGCHHLRVLITDYRAVRHVHRKRKVEAIKEAAKKLGVQVNEDDHVHTLDANTYDEGLRVARLYLGSVADDTAVICLQDAVAHAVMDFISQREQTQASRKNHVLVAGYDNSPTARNLRIPSVDQGLKDAGARAVEWLYRFANRRRAADDALIQREFYSKAVCHIPGCGWSQPSQF